MWRACVNFGPPIKHTKQEANSKEIHCVCKSLWDTSDDQCYGDKYSYVYNFFRNLRPLIEDFSPDKCFFVLEGHPQFRYDLYGDYKANRLVKLASRQEANDKFIQAK